MIYSEEVKEVKNENGEVWIKINDNERFKLGEDFLIEFLKEKSKSGLDNALTILSNEEVKRALENIVRYYCSNGKIVKSLVNNLGFFERYVPELKEKIKENFKYFADSMDLSPEEIYEIARQLGLESELEKYLSDRIINGSFHGKEIEEEVSGMLKEALFFAKIYPDAVKRFTTIKANYVLEALNYYISYIEKGRGLFIREFGRNIVFVERLKDFLSDEKIQEIQDKLVENIEVIRKIVKRRSKLEDHQPYLKAIMSFLPDEYKTQLISYFI